MRSSITLVFLVLAACFGGDQTQLQGQNLGTSHLIQSKQASTPPPGRSLVQEVVGPEATQTESAAPAAAQAQAQAQADAAQKPWSINSRIHIQKGSSQGYLVVQLQLADGHHVYSLNPEGSLSPSRLAVLPSNNMRVKSKFVADKPPIVIENDPVFERRIEKHKGQVRFFAPIEIRAGIDPTKLTQEVQFSAQVCSDAGCRPIRDLKINATFGGYFDVPKTGSTWTNKQSGLH